MFTNANGVQLDPLPAFKKASVFPTDARGHRRYPIDYKFSVAEVLAAKRATVNELSELTEVPIWNLYNWLNQHNEGVLGMVKIPIKKHKRHGKIIPAHFRYIKHPALKQAKPVTEIVEHASPETTHVPATNDHYNNDPLIMQELEFLKRENTILGACVKALTEKR